MSFAPLTIHDVEDVSLLHRSSEEVRPRPPGVYGHILDHTRLMNRRSDAIPEVEQRAEQVHNFEQKSGQLLLENMSMICA